MLSKLLKVVLKIKIVGKIFKVIFRVLLLCMCTKSTQKYSQHVYNMVLHDLNYNQEKAHVVCGQVK